MVGADFQTDGKKVLTLLLLEPKVISLCHQCRASPVCTSVQAKHS